MCFRFTALIVQGEVVVRKQLKRSQVRRFFTNVEPCLVGMEACGGAHYWTRELAGLGHTRSDDGTNFRQTVPEDQQERPQ